MVCPLNFWGCCFKMSRWKEMNGSYKSNFLEWMVERKLESSILYTMYIMGRCRQIAQDKNEIFNFPSIVGRGSSNQIQQVLKFAHIFLILSVYCDGGRVLSELSWTSLISCTCPFTHAVQSTVKLEEFKFSGVNWYFQRTRQYKVL